jgi:hypothetical protein
VAIQVLLEAAIAWDPASVVGPPLRRKTAVLLGRAAMAVFPYLSRGKYSTELEIFIPTVEKLSRGIVGMREKNGENQVALAK